MLGLGIFTGLRSAIFHTTHTPPPPHTPQHYTHHHHHSPNPPTTLPAGLGGAVGLVRLKARVRDVQGVQNSEF